MTSLSEYPFEKLSFRDYLEVIQCTRWWADGYDRKDIGMLEASLAPEVIVDYSKVTGVEPLSFKAAIFARTWLDDMHIGNQTLRCHHMLGLPLIKSVTSDEIVIEFQHLVGFARIAEDDVGKKQAPIVEKDTAPGFSTLHFTRHESRWKISAIRPAMLYEDGNFADITRKEGLPSQLAK